MLIARATSTFCKNGVCDMKPSLGLSVELGLRQELKLQPVQILRNELLVLPVLDLEARLQSEVEENVFLESEEQPEVRPLLPEPEPSEKMTPPGGDDDLETARMEQFSDPGQLGNLLQYLKDSRSTVAPSGGDVPDAFDVEGRVSLPTSWRQDLQASVRLEKLSEQQERIAEYIVGCLDERGYLREPLEDIADVFGAEPSEVETVLKVVQRVAPAGGGARDLREHLLLQCRALPEPCENLEHLLENAFDELLHGKWERIKRMFGWSQEDVLEVLTRLRELARVSGPEEEGEPVSGVVPDATVRKTEDGWTVSLRDESVPRLRLSPYAMKLARNANNLPDQAKEYLQKSLNRAKWMMEALEQRKRTLRRIVEAVVKRQERWLEEGGDTLVPLRQEDVATELGLHPATISRAAQGKYVDTPHGLVPLKAFFPAGVPSVSGVRRSRNSAKERLRAIVEAEDPENPYSDHELTQLLANEDIKISRRTVAKYRGELGIPAAFRRKGLYKVLGDSRSR